MVGETLSVILVPDELGGGHLHILCVGHLIHMHLEAGLLNKDIADRLLAMHLLDLKEVHLTLQCVLEIDLALIVLEIFLDLHRQDAETFLHLTRCGEDIERLRQIPLLVR